MSKMSNNESAIRAKLVEKAKELVASEPEDTTRNNYLKEKSTV